MVLFLISCDNRNNLNGTWEAIDQISEEKMSITFNGNNFIWESNVYSFGEMHNIELKGTYSITDDKLELKITNLETEGFIVYKYFLTENTLTINSEGNDFQFIKKK